MPKARIGTVKRAFRWDIIAAHLPRMRGDGGVRPVFEEGQAFQVPSPFAPRPEGGCDWAWADTRKVVGLTMMGANPTPGPSTPAAATACGRSRSGSNGSRI